MQPEWGSYYMQHILRGQNSKLYIEIKEIQTFQKNPEILHRSEVTMSWAEKCCKAFLPFLADRVRGKGSRLTLPANRMK